MKKQVTIKHEISATGIGIHSGSEVKMVLKPAAVDTGIVFRRMDISDKPEVSASYDLVSDTKLGTTITNEAGVSVSTIEHLMAALWGAGIDNIIVDLDGPEVPIMDGSSEPFTFLLECAGVEAQYASRRYLKVLKAVEVREGDAYAILQPGSGFVVDLGIDFSGSVIGKQHAVVDFNSVSFKSAISRARTFGFENEVNFLRSQGLALGGSLKNAIVVGSNGILNEDGLRFEDEFVKHKVLDVVGDMYLAGFRIEGTFVGYKSGHCLNNRLLHALLADESAWKIISFDTEESSHMVFPQAEYLHYQQIAA